MLATGICSDRDLVEIVEIPDHKWFIAVQFHPEFKSRPLSPHPLFANFVRSALEQQGAREEKNKKKKKKSKKFIGEHARGAN